MVGSDRAEECGQKLPRSLGARHQPKNWSFALLLCLDLETCLIVYKGALSRYGEPHDMVVEPES